MKSKDIKDAFQYFIILVLVVSMIVLILKLFNVVLPVENKDIALILIGAFSAKFGDAIAFLLNSSKGSAEKSETLSKLPALPIEGADISMVKKTETTETETSDSTKTEDQK